MQIQTRFGRWGRSTMIGKPTLLITAMLIFTLNVSLSGCAANNISAVVKTVAVEDLEKERRPFEYLREVRAKCSKWRCHEISIEACQAKLKKEAHRINANAIEPITLTKHGRGHGGGELFAISCSAKAIKLLPSIDSP